MSFKAGLEEQVGRLVHPTAQGSPDEFARHRLFIETRLAVGFGALAIVPSYLVCGGVPGWPEALVLGWLMLPLLAVALLAAGGTFARAELVSQGAWVGLAGTLVLGHLASAVTASFLLMLVPLEASLNDDPRASRRAALAVCLLAAALLVVGTADLGAFRVPDIMFAACAVGYGAVLLAQGSAARGARAAANHAATRHSTMLFDAVGDLALRFDGLGATVLNAPAAQAQFGLAGDELAGRGFFDRVHIQDRPLFLKLVSDASHGAGSVSDRLRLRVAARPGAEHGFDQPVFAEVEMRARAMPAEHHGAPGGTLVLLRGVTAAAEQAPTVAATDESETQAWRDRFLATVSHELRTPLNAIIGFSEVLATGFNGSLQPEKQREYAGIIHGSGQHLLEIVNSMLDLSKIDAGKLDLVFEPFDLNTLLAACCDMMRLKAEQGRVDLERVGSTRPLPMVGDARACRQIILNLMSNALKFTPEYGRVTVTASAEGSMMALSVTDTGIGILPPDLARLGDPFFQAQNTYDRRFEGTGLGLCVVRGLVGLHGGTITAESAPGQGTRVTVRLPAEERVARHGIRATIETIARSPRDLPSELLPLKVTKIA